MATKKISDLQLISAMADNVNIPGENTSQTYRVTGAQLLTYIDAALTAKMKQAQDLWNIGLAASVSGNALTIALKQQDGSSNASSSSPVKIGFRGTTLANGNVDQISITAALSLVISSGSTLGHFNAVEHPIFIYAINNGGTVILGASTTMFDDGDLVSTTAEGGAGAADSNRLIYAASAVSSKPCRLIGRLTSTQTTAGTWAAAPTEIAVWPNFKRERITLRYQNTAGTSLTSSAAALPFATRIHDRGGCWSGTSFTAPKAGRFRFAVQTFTASVSNSVNQFLGMSHVVTSTPEGLSGQTNYFALVWGTGTSHGQVAQGGKTFNMAAGDTISFTAENGANVNLETTAGNNWMTIEEVS